MLPLLAIVSKKYWKEIMIGILVLLLCGAAGSTTLMYTKFKSEQHDKENVIQLTSGKDLTIKEYENDNGKLVTRVKSLEIQNTTIKQLADAGQLDWLKEFDGLKKNMSNLESAFRLQAKAGDSINVKLQQLQLTYINEHGDTIMFQGVKFKYSDKYANIRAVQISPDSANLVYDIQVPVSGVLYSKKKWFLGKKRYEAELITDNPHAKLDSIITLQVKKRHKHK